MSVCWGGGGCGCGLWVVWLLKAGDTRYSQPVTHASTDRAQRCLTAVIGREPVLSTWYGRRQLHIHSNCTSTLHTITPNTQPITTTRQHTQSIFIHSITHSLTQTTQITAFIHTDNYLASQPPITHPHIHSMQRPHTLINYTTLQSLHITHYSFTQPTDT